MCLSPRPEAEQRKAFRHVLSSRLELGMVVRSPPSLSSVGNWDGFCFPQAACLCSFRIGPSNSMFLKLCAVGFWAPGVLPFSACIFLFRSLRLMAVVVVEAGGTCLLYLYIPVHVCI